MASRLLQRGLTSSGAATTVTLCSWMGEQSTSKATSRVVSRSLERLAVARPPYSFWRQQCKVFSTKTTEAAVPLPPSKAAAAPFKGFLQWYEGHLEASPVKTKMVTGGILWGLGDLVAQLVPQVTFDGGKSDDDSSKERHFTYDFPRTSRAVIFGGLFHAPTSHVHFNFLEWMTVRAGITGLMIPVFKAVMEQVCSVASMIATK